MFKESKKTIKICKSDARRLNLPAGAVVTIEPIKSGIWTGNHKVYYLGRYFGNAKLDRPNGI